jgi:ATP-dependent DNA helicase RecG
VTWIKPERLPIYKRLVGERVMDLLWHLPSQLISEKHLSSFTEAQLGHLISIVVTVRSHQFKKKPYWIEAEDVSGHLIKLIFFKEGKISFQTIAPLERRIGIRGTLRVSSQTLQMVHPQFFSSTQSIDLSLMRPVYPLTAGLHQSGIDYTIQKILNALEWPPEWIPETVRQALHFPSLKETLTHLHRAQTLDDLHPKGRWKGRLIFDEFLAHHASRLCARVVQSVLRASPLSGTSQLLSKLQKQLPFSLTSDQIHAFHEIQRDLAKNYPMTRLLQGDVGSGKTLVALQSMLQAVESGFQAALLVPTEILAHQHFQTFQNYCAPMGVSVSVLTGQGKERQEQLVRLRDGSISIVIGTHALIQDPVQWHRLGLVVTDEQHRFGVEQRFALLKKGLRTFESQAGWFSHPHMLSMTATPIPRTLLLVQEGQWSVSTLRNKPPGRSPIQTKAIPLQRLEEVEKSLHTRLQKGEQAYWVCPLIEESETLDLTPALMRWERLRFLFPNLSIGLLHGQQRNEEKQKTMRDFQSGSCQILVATTVVEVGIDVPQATIMIIEHAERFGLAQLHQLRGRVGRGSQESFCLLLYDPHTTSITARRRLKVLCETSDGFRVAQMDLMIRGGGSPLSTQQSGIPRFRFSNFQEENSEILEYYEFLYQKSAETISSLSPQSMQILQELFGIQKASGYQQAG